MIDYLIIEKTKVQLIPVIRRYSKNISTWWASHAERFPEHLRKNYVAILFSPRNHELLIESNILYDIYNVGTKNLFKGRPIR
mgnify:CR=1 FL=1